ncbi:flippase-like domain-containing protein [Myxococcota bacterium]|nr:flippase-like domain-containing protein [Myxococcota bacterium]
MSAPPEPGTLRTSRSRVVAAWIGTALLLGYLAATTDLGTAWDALRHADLPRILWTLLWAIPATYLVDSIGVTALLRRVGVRVPFGEFLRVKGASYLLNIINYNLGLVLMAAVVKNRSDRGWGSAGSPFLLLNFLDLSVFGMLVIGALSLGQCPFPDPAVRTFLWAAAAGATLAPPFLMALSRIPKDRGWIGRMAGHGILEAFRRLDPAALPLVIGSRTGLVLLYALMNRSFLLAFGTDIPLGKLLVFMPILTLVAFMPISVSGLGSTQVVMRSFYGPFVSPAMAATEAARTAVIDAFSTTTILATVLVRAAIGIACLPWVSKALARGRGEGEGW